MDYTFLPGVDVDPELASAELKTALEQTDLSTLLEAELLTRLVAPDEVLATIDPDDAPDQDLDLQAGEHVRCEQRGLISEIYGYMCLTDHEISVLPPIWVSSDRMEAHFIHFPQVSPEPLPQSDWLLGTLLLYYVSHGIQESAVERLCQQRIDQSEKTSVLIARGDPPVPGVDTQVTLYFEPEKKAGRVKEDGSIDLRERNAAIAVRSGQLLAEVKPATQGRAGMDLGGEEIPTTDGQERTLTAGENVRSDMQDESTRFHAEIDGNIQLEDDTLHVRPVYLVSGDVDYQTGNIDVPNDVQVSGSVLSGFTVKSGGSITVGGSVEQGAVVSAQGDIVVSNGIVGETTKVVTLEGDVETAFIQNSTVMAQGDITIGKYIMNGRVRASGKVTVRSALNDNRGSIMSGEVYGAKGIEARMIGSRSNAPTTVGIGPSTRDMAQLKKVDEVIAFCENNIARMLRTLGSQVTDPGKIKDLISSAEAPRRELFINIIRKLGELVETREEYLLKREEIHERIANSGKDARIKVTERVFSGVTIRIDDMTQTVSADLRGGAIFFRGSDGIRMQPV